MHIIPLSYYDVQLRKAMKVYRDPGLILRDDIEKSISDKIKQAGNTILSKKKEAEELNKESALLQKKKSALS